MKIIKNTLQLLALGIFLIACKDGAPKTLCELPANDYEFQIRENTIQGNFVGDVGLFGVDHVEYAVNYLITNGNIDNAFEIDLYSGFITVLTRSAVDYEKTTSFDLEITASAEGCNPVVYMVKVNIENVVDKPFVDPFYKKLNRDQLVIYGEANIEDQVMDVYYPINETERHPLLVIAGGGRWFPSDLDNFIDIGTRMAQAGYAVASIRYISDIQNVMDPQIRSITGVQDLRTAIRFFRKDAATIDKYKIDTNNVFIGGFGTGAFLALQTYADESDIDQANLDLINNNGGFEGENRGNAGYSSEFKAVVSMAGALYDLNWIDENEPPISCVHAINDPEVAFGQGSSSSGASTFGSELIINRATEINLYNQLVAIDSENHDAPVECDACYVEILKFLEPLIE